MSIVIDIDGVVADSDEWLIKEIQERSGKPVIHKNPRVFQYGVDISEDDLLKYIDSAIIRYKDEIDVHDYGRTFIGLLMIEKVFGKVHFLTARSPYVREATEYWLDTMFEGLDYDLHVIGQGINKGEWMKQHGFDSIIEDRLKTVNNINFQTGSTYLVNRDWNMGRPTAPHVIRVNEMYEAVEDYVRI